MLAQSTADNVNPDERRILKTPSPEEATVVPNHTNQLLDKVEELLIENRALDSALEAVKRLLPPEAQEKVRSHIEAMKSDSMLGELVHRRFTQYRSQSLDVSFSQLLEQDLKKKV
jgi:hypothetical protein